MNLSRIRYPSHLRSPGHGDRVDERTLVRRDISLELRKVSTNTVEAVNRCYYSSAYGDPVYFTTYNYRDGVYAKDRNDFVSAYFSGFYGSGSSAL